MTATLFAIVLVIGLAFYFLGGQRARGLAGDTPALLHSRPSYHGLYSLLWVLVLGWGILIVLTIVTEAYIGSTLLSQIAQALPDAPVIEHQLVLNDARALAEGRVASNSDALRVEISQRYGTLTSVQLLVLWVSVLGGAFAGGAVTLAKVSLEKRARNKSEKIIRGLLFAMAGIAILTTVGIIFSLIFETVSFFSNIGWRFDKYLFGSVWSPLSGVQSGQMDADRVGAVPLFVGTGLITLIAMFVAVPIGLFAAIYLSDFAGPKTRSIVKPLLEILAGIPTVVYGFFAAITVAPFIRGAGEAVGLQIASESALVAGVVMGIMIIPFISSLSDDVINAVPQSLRDGSYGLGATKAETMRQVILPAALPGIVSAVLLGVSRAVGETMIVVMAAGQGARLTVNPFEAVTTVTVQIVMLITGDTEASTAAGPAFTLGFTLFVVTLLMNIVAQRVVRRYREMYD